MTAIKLAYWTAVIALMIVYRTVPAARPFVVALIGAGGVASIIFGIVSLRPQRRLAWKLLAAAVGLVAVGDVIVIAQNTSGPVDYPGPQVWFFLLAYLPLAVGLFLLGQPRLPSRDSLMVLDVLGLSLACSLLAWIFVVRPAVQSLQLAGVELLVAISSWVGYSVVLAVSARALFSWRANPALALVSGGAVALLTANVLFLRALVAGDAQIGGFTDLGFIALGAVCGAAALTNSMTTVSSANEADHRLGPVRLTMLAIALLLGPAVLLVEATSGRVATGVAIALFSAAVGVLLLIRIAVTARLVRQRLARVDAVRNASRTLLSATTERDVVETVRVALVAMLPPGTDHSVRLVGGPPEADGQPKAKLRRRDATPDGQSDISDLAVPLPADVDPVQAGGDEAGPDAGDERATTLVFAAPTDQLLELYPALLSLGDSAGSAMQRIRLVAALTSEERERYFRTLVMTSTDVTLISRNGRIDYATPSSLTMFGRDIRGEAFDDVVNRQPETDQNDESWSDTVDGDDGYVVRSDGGSDIVVVHRRDLADDPTIRGVVSTLRNVTRERALQRDLAYRASHDPLTGLANVELFGQELSSVEDRAADHRRGALSATGRAAIFVDLDDFKSVNDTYGHEIGDRVLVEAARRIESCLRPDDVAARIGGDEFAVLLRELPDVATAGSIAQRIVETLAGAVTTDASFAGCRASVGVAYAPGPVDPDQLLRQADAALYTAKAHGKGEWRLYDGASAIAD